MTRARTALAALAVVVPAFAAASTGGPADAVAVATDGPRVSARPDVYTVTGRVVRFGNDRPVRGVSVSAYDAGETEFVGSDLTDARGRFVIRGAEAEDNEFGIYVRGRRVGLQNGWLGCNRTLYPTFGEACTFSTPVGRIRIKAAAG